MQSKAMLAAWVFMAGCGAAQVEATHPVSEEVAVTETAPVEAASEEVGEAVVATPIEPPPMPRESPLETGVRVVNCDDHFPRADVPDEPVRFTSGPLQVRAQSLVLDAYPDADTVTYCVSRTPVPEGSRLVFFIDDYDTGATRWDGRALANPYTRFEPVEGEPDSGSEVDWRTVNLRGQTVTAVRQMAYCPTNPRRPCLAAGDYVQLMALPYGDPRGPRSGWDFTERAVQAVPSRPATNVTGIDACGLNVAYRRIPECTATTDVELDACLSSFRMNCIYDGEGSPAACANAQLVLSDGANEIALPARDARQIACVDHVAIVYDSTVEALSRRSFVAIEQAQGRITQALRMTIQDHEQARSDCMNAWDGVSLAPILGQGRLVGAVVRGAGASPRFDVGRGDVGEAVLAPATEAEEMDHYDDEPTPRAYQVTSEGLAPLEVSTTPTAPPCPLHVVDPDGETNIRPSPSTRRPPVGTIPTGTMIQPVEQRGRWYRIEAPQAGWLFAGSLARRCGR